MTLKNLTLLLACFCFTISETHAQKFAVDTVLKSGSISNRVNIVFMGDGYTAAQQTKFSNDVNTMVTGLFAAVPFNQYKSFCNVFAIHVISQDSGAKHPFTAPDCPPLTTQPIANPNNYFGSTFDYSNIHRFLMPTNTAAITSVLTANLPQYDLVVMLVNTPYYGGAAEGQYAICSSGDPSSIETMLHEMGHSLAGLGDEYSYSGCGGIEEWNATEDTGLTTCRWKAWFPNGVKDNSCTSIGTYLGANYCPTSWFRPECNCRMRALGNPYCHICLERFVYSFSYYVNLIDSYSPASTSVTLSSAGQTQNFSAGFVTPSPNSLHVTWKLDNVLVASNVSSYLVNSNNISVGSHTLVLTVVDSTYHSRTTMPSYSKTWTISNTRGSSLTLATLSSLCYNSPAITLTGGLPVGGTYSGTGVSNGAFNPAVSGPGTFSITYTLAGVSVSQNITVYGLPSLTLTTSSPNVCTGNSTALNASGATTYAWLPATYLNSVTGASVTSTPSTTTTYTVTGISNGCSKTLTSVVTVNPYPSVTVSPGTTVCNGSTASLSAGGAGTYSWTPSTGLNTATGASVLATPSASTAYYVTGTLNGCSTTVSTSVTVTAGITLSTSSNISICSGTATALGASGASTYTWSPATGLTSTTTAVVTATPSVTTTYTVTGTAGNCSASKAIVVTVNPGVSLSTSSNTSVCNGTSATLGASGATTYKWSPSTGLNSTTASVVTALPASTTTYTVTGTSGGCSASKTIVVSVGSGVPLVTSSNTSVCGGTSTPLGASGATTYSWAPATGLNNTTASSVTALPASTTTYTVTGSTGACSSSKTIVVTVSQAISLATSSNTSVCSGTSTTIGASGATNYSWAPATGLNNTTASSVSALPASTTTYTVTGTSGSCSASKAIVVTVGTAPSVNVSLSASSLCGGSSATLTASGASTYTWSPALGLSSTSLSTVSASPTASTVYTVTGTSNGCSRSVSTSLTVNPAPSVSVNPGTASVCSGTTVMLTASGASTYLWTPSTRLTATSGTSVSATPSVTTTYAVTGTSVAGCSSLVNVVLNVNPNPSLSTSSNATVCAGTATTIGASGATTYSWSPVAGLNNVTSSSVSAAPSTTTTYTVTGYNGGCAASSTIVVNVQASPALATTPNTSICNGTAATLTASGATTYSWSPVTGLSKTTGASVTASPSVNTTYVVTGTLNGCSKAVAVAVGVGTVPTLSVSSNATICTGSSATLGVAGATTYSWSPSASLNNASNTVVTASPATSTTYTVTGSINGCSSSRTISVSVNPQPPVTVTPNTSICSGSIQGLSAAGATSYTWSPAVGINVSTGSVVSAVPSSSITYTVTGTTNGCSKTATVAVTVNTPPTVNYSVTNPPSGTSTGAIDLTPQGGISPYSYRWSNGSIAQNATGLAAGTYTVTVTSGACAPVASIILSPVLSSCDTVVGALDFLSTSGTATFVTWGGVAGAYKYLLRLRKKGTTTWTSTQSAIAPNAAAYFSGLSLSTQYEVQIQTQCSSDGSSVSAYTSSWVFTTLTAREEEDMEAQDGGTAQDSAGVAFTLNLYPNPTTGQVNLLFNGTENEQVTIQVFDITGKQVYFQQWSSMDGVNLLPLNLADLAGGTYILAATRNEDRIVKKFIKVQ